MKNREYYASELAKAVAEGNACKFKKERVHNALDCGGIDCKQCAEKAKQWLDQEANVKPRFTRMEYDVLDALQIIARRAQSITAPGFILGEILRDLKARGYFKDLDKDQDISDFLASCEVVEDD